MNFIAYQCVIQCDFDLKIQTSSNPPELIISEHHIEIPKNLKKTKIKRFNAVAYFGYNNENMVLHWPEICTFELTKTNQLFYQKHSPDTPIDLLRVFVLSEALGLYLYQKGYLLLHASAVNINQNAHVFLGLPGAGKSTTIAGFAHQKFDILGDDMVAIEIDQNGKPWVIPSFAEIKIWDSAVVGLDWDKSELEPAWEGKEKYILKGEKCPFKDIKLPLTQINIIKKPNARKTETLSAAVFPIELLKYIPIPHQIFNGNNLKNHFKNSVLIANFVKLQSIKRQKDFGSLIKFTHEYASNNL